MDVRSEITGVVIEIQSPAGAAVDVDDTIMLLESMKMEIAIAAPKAGTIVELLVNEGDEVGEGQVVARIG